MKKIWSAGLDWLGQLKWESLRERLTGRRFSLTANDLNQVENVLKKGNYIILTRRKAHMSTYLCNLAHFAVTRRWGYWSHVAMNLEPNDVRTRDEIKIFEAIGSGSQLNPFDKVFDCDAVCILEPRLSGSFDWPGVVARAREAVEQKRPYDDFFNLKDPSALSCVELGRWCMEADPEYEDRMHGLEAFIQRFKNLTPDMFVECGSFRVILEIRR